MVYRRKKAGVELVTEFTPQCRTLQKSPLCYLGSWLVR